jgi:hypothetical protein
MKSISPIRLCVALIALIFTQQAYCAGSSVANKSVKIFKELIVEGERPEISSCLTAAIQSVKVNPVYSKINWEPEMSIGAVVKEYLVSGSLVKETTLKALALVRDERLLHLDNWTNVTINCQQINEGKPILSFKKDF